MLKIEISGQTASGKTTIAQAIADHLSVLGLSVNVTDDEIPTQDAISQRLTTMRGKTVSITTKLTK